MRRGSIQGGVARKGLFQIECMSVLVKNESGALRKEKTIDRIGAYDTQQIRRNPVTRKSANDFRFPIVICCIE